MSLIWVEPFDQYGANNAMYQGGSFGYTDTALSGWVNPGRTGNYSLSISNAGTLRRALDTTLANCGQGAAILPQTGGTGNASNAQGFHYESAGKTHELSCVVLLDLSIGVYDRLGNQVGKTAPNALIVGSFSWVECKVLGNVGGVINTGSCEVRVNGISKVIVNGINLPNLIAYVGIGGATGGWNYWDDWIVWDTNGAKNNNFMGDRRLILNMPNANGATQNFTPSAGNAWACVNLTPPVDTTYIDGAAAGNISEFPKTALGIAANDIAAVVVIGRMFKTDAGVASGTVGINSVANVVNCPAYFPGTTGSWTRLIQELDPNGNIPWTQAAYDAASIRVTRAS